MENIESGSDKCAENRSGELPVFLIKGLKDVRKHQNWGNFAEKMNLTLVLLYEQATDDFSEIILDYKGLKMFEKSTLMPEGTFSPEILMDLLKYLDKQYKNGKNIVLILDEGLLNKRIGFLDANKILFIDHNQNNIQFLLTDGSDNIVEAQKYNLDFSGEHQKLLLETIYTELRAVKESIDANKNLNVNVKKELINQTSSEKRYIGETGLYISDSDVYRENGKLLFKSGTAKNCLFIMLADVSDSNIGLDKEEIKEKLKDEKHRYTEDGVVTLISKTNGDILKSSNGRIKRLIDKLPKTNSRDKAKYYLNYKKYQK